VNMRIKVVFKLYDTDGAQGAARGAGIGAGDFASIRKHLEGLSFCWNLVEPNSNFFNQYEDVSKLAPMP